MKILFDQNKEKKKTSQDWSLTAFSKWYTSSLFWVWKDEKYENKT